MLTCFGAVAIQIVLPDTFWLANPTVEWYQIGAVDFAGAGPISIGVEAYSPAKGDPSPDELTQIARGCGLLRGRPGELVRVELGLQQSLSDFVANPSAEHRFWDQVFDRSEKAGARIYGFKIVPVRRSIARIFAVVMFAVSVGLLVTALITRSSRTLRSGS